MGPGLETPKEAGHPEQLDYGPSLTFHASRVARASCHRTKPQGTGSLPGCSWEYTSWEGPDLGDGPQSEEAYARRMWEDMQRRKSARQGPSAATAEV